ncbi:ARF guanine-nucleotide exchange factor GNL2 [Rhynchospora pubera]|uniref:ARF guanine-nucleotide exchange factor GNL2 n=1 Tax=Rhynchospora pubera TaxID=906938 RepID=A0AAV8DU46_9POAL|nr:ARF guanine-nucleotide exchange factor GNL2 [Rhynchospora pubera]
MVAVATTPDHEPRLNQLSISCMLNTEVGAVLAVIRRTIDPTLVASSILLDDHLVQSLKALRAIIFHTNWHATDPTVYLSPFLDVIQSDDVPAAATGAALSAVLKILQFGVFDDQSPGAFDAIHLVVSAITSCRLERTDPSTEDAILMRVLQVLLALLRCPAGRLLTDHAICTMINTGFQVVQQSVNRGDLLQRSARHTMHEVIQTIFLHLPEIRPPEPGAVDLSELEHQLGSITGYGSRCMVDIFNFLCSLLNVGDGAVTTEGYGPSSSDEDVQLFTLVLINSAIELGGESIGWHPRLLQLIQDDLFHHLIHYATRSGPLVLSMICSTVLNLYHFLRRSLRLQLEAFFVYVLLRIGSGVSGPQLQEVAVESIISFCRQPTFIVEMFVNYDCDPIRHNVLEEIGKLLCKTAYPQINGNQMTPIQIHAFTGLVHIFTTIAESIESTATDTSNDKEKYKLDMLEYEPALDRDPPDPDSDTWVEFVRKRKLKKNKTMIAAHHYNKDEKKGIEYLKFAKLVATPPEPKTVARFFRYTPGLDKQKIGEYLGDPGEFNIQVLKEFTETFDFTGVILDTALRTFLETFRLPGEAQKIQRIIEVFSEKFFEQQSSGIFATKDAVFLLCYSLIMLNTDHHNPQVKKKMTEEEFIKNNRAINEGLDLPREYLSELFHSISTNAIALFSKNASAPKELNANLWSELIRRSRVVDPFIMCDFKHELIREAFATISGPSVATLMTIFDYTNDEEIRSECIEGMISVARIAQYGLSDVLDELLSCLCKFTTLLNPYSCTEDTQAEFNQSVKMRMALLALFTIANRFGKSVHAAWKNIVDCVIKLRRIKLLPPFGIDSSNGSATLTTAGSTTTKHNKSDSGVIFPPLHNGLGTSRYVSGMIGRFSQILSLDTGAESMINLSSESEVNMKLMQQCRIVNIFTESGNFSEESLQHLGRALIFVASGKGQKFTSVGEEQDTIIFCYDLLMTVTSANLHRFLAFWPQFHEAFLTLSQYTIMSPYPFPEKAIAPLFRIATKIVSPPHDKQAEEAIFKSIQVTVAIENTIDMCYDTILPLVKTLIDEHAGSIQSPFVWKTLLVILATSGRNPQTFDDAIETLNNLMTGPHLTKANYMFWADASFNLGVHKATPLDKSVMILEMLGKSIHPILQWHKSSISDPNNNNTEGNTEDISLRLTPYHLFMKLVTDLTKPTLARREEIRNKALIELKCCFQTAAESLDLSHGSCLNCFKNLVLPTVDNLYQKTIDYFNRHNMERETISMGGTFREAMDFLAYFYALFVTQLWQDDDFMTSWLFVLRRMDTWIKTYYGGDCTMEIRAHIPLVLKIMLQAMRDNGILVPKEGDPLWESTEVQAKWIAPTVIDELFPQ